ncbi:MAG: prepilin-type N-terminal cleavage/methylation domain-containing protein [Anaeromyxobacteraceae bacterium]
MPEKSPRKARGFTLVEMAVVVAIVSVLGALAWSNLWRLRPRAQLADASSELVALVHGARQHALATGNDVAVMFFPTYAGAGTTGRVVVYEDGNADFFLDTGAVNFAAYDPAVLKRGSRSTIVADYDLPRNVVIGPATGAGASATLVAPLAAIPVNVDCSFCATGGDRRGAIRFDSRGRASFYSANTGAGQPAANVVGGSISLAAPEVAGQRTLLVTAGTGSVTLHNQGG